MKIIIEAHINYRCWQLIDQDSEESYDGLIADVFNEKNAVLIASFLNKGNKTLKKEKPMTDREILESIESLLKKLVSEKKSYDNSDYKNPLNKWEKVFNEYIKNTKGKLSLDYGDLGEDEKSVIREFDITDWLY